MGAPAERALSLDPGAESAAMGLSAARRHLSEVEGQPPAVRRCVVVAAPHTSNWDLPWMLLFARAFGLRPCFMMKHSLFRGPAGRFR